MPARTRSRSARKPPFDVNALWALKRLGAPTISPDGGCACAPVTSYDMGKNEGTTELWLFPTGLGGQTPIARPRRLTAGDKDSDPRWAPDGRLIAFTAKRKDDDEPQIYLIAPDGGEAERLTRTAGGASAIKWFADGKRIAFVSWVWPDLATDAAQARRRNPAPCAPSCSSASPAKRRRRPPSGAPSSRRKDIRRRRPSRPTRERASWHGS